MTTTTYSAYAGEFSSDDDFETTQRAAATQQQSKWNKFDIDDNASKEAIEAAIENLRSLPIDAEYEISDELLAGGLDHYRAQRGPIVDSTRRLYKKILLRAIKEGNEAKDNGSDDVENQQLSTEQLNGKEIGSSNYNTESSSSHRVYKHQQNRSRVIEDYSSDDDDIVMQHKPARYELDRDVEMVTIGDENTPQFRSTKIIETTSDSETEEDNDESSEDDDDDTQEDIIDAESKGPGESQSNISTQSPAGCMSSSTPINTTSRLRKLAAPSHPKGDSFEKQSAARCVPYQRRPTTRSQLGPNSSRTSLEEERQASSSTVNQKDTSRRFNLLRSIVKCIILVLVLYISYRFYRSLSIEQPKGFRARLPNSIQF